MQRDTGFNEKLVTYLYALEVQQLVESGQEGSLADVQEAYDIPQERAEQIVEVRLRYDKSIRRHNAPAQYHLSSAEFSSGDPCLVAVPVILSSSLPFPSAQSSLLISMPS